MLAKTIRHTIQRWIPITGLLALACMGCQGDARQPSDGKLHIVATTSIIADTARMIGGETVHVDALMGPGIDPHRYSPTAGDLSRVAAADVILSNGLHLEGKMADVLARPGRRVVSIAIGDKIDSARLMHVEDGDGPFDPHIWMDPLVWAEAAKTISEALQNADPANASQYAERTRTLVQELEDLHREIQSAVETIPTQRRILVTSHDAFGYYGRAYGLQVRGLQGVSTVAETSTKDVTELASFLGSQRVPAVFCETSVPPRGLEAVLDSVRTQYKHNVRLIGDEQSLYSDALGPPDSPGATYFSMLRHNTRVIVQALSATP